MHAEAVEADLGWALGAVFRGYLRATEEALAGLPGGPRGYQVLTSAARCEPTRQLAMAHRLGVDRTVMTYLIDDLENAGLVERRPDPADRRARLLSATELGLARLDEANRAMRAAEDHVLGALDPRERDRLRGLLRKVAVAVAEPTNPCAVVQEAAALDGTR
ncbi:MarR family winged helix-turn-helix transcriptional regulator [Actinokineospora sp. G85]|uniref:MarR family winged helix-turn-helix transcriptional regulator n=1 Tax=Actinokineospora sp. G85 TaxID=3406626 RepID=UPI003C72E292